MARFYEGERMNHSSSSILMCVGEIPDLDLACWANKDWKCLADLAERIERSLAQ